MQSSAVLAGQARELARRLLAPLPERWQHTVGVAWRARLLAVRLDLASADTLVAAAWLHDIGYAPALRDTGFHPLDGARLLDGLDWAHSLSPLVAHHSGARFVAAVRGLGPALSEYPYADDELTDALTYADQTVGPGGRLMAVEDRVAEAVRRHGPHSHQARANPVREPYLLAAAERVRRRLAVAAASRHIEPPAERRIELPAAEQCVELPTERHIELPSERSAAAAGR